MLWIEGVIQPKQGCTGYNKIPRLKTFRLEFIGPSSVYWEFIVPGASLLWLNNSFKPLRIYHSHYLELHIEIYRRLRV